MYEELLTPIQIRIFNELSTGKSLTRRYFVNILDTPRTTIYDNLVKLQRKKLVNKYSTNKGKHGRPLVFWHIKKEILFNKFCIADKNSEN